jgi:hypothetical protein
MPFSTIDKGSKHFNTILRNGGGGTITGVGFQPDLVWQKARSSASSHYLHDAVRGVTKALFSNSTSAEATYTDQITSFDTDGFTVNAGGDWGSGTTVVDWCWKANGAGVSNTAGSITSTVSANTTSGFSIVTYTGGGSFGNTVGHGMGIKPAMVIIKKRASSSSWYIWQKEMGATDNQFMDFSTGALQTSGATIFDVSEFSSTTFTLGTNTDVNGSGATYVAYCFAEVKGFSKFGKYTGNNSLNNFVYTGFKPAFVMVKVLSTTEQWCIKDNKRNTINPLDRSIFANANNAEDYNTTNHLIDFVSNGFNLKDNTSQNLTNGNGQTYIYMAFAESPIVSSKGIPTTAR